MKQSEFIRTLVARSGVCEPTVRQVLRTTKDVITEILIRDEELCFEDFGAFHIKRHGAHPCFLPGHNKEMIPVSGKPAFRASYGYKKYVSEQLKKKNVNL